MRLFPILTAILVVIALYMVVFERDRVLEFAGYTPPPAEETVTEPAAEPADQARRFAVVAMHSQAQEIASLVVVRGRTEAARQVNVVAETSGKVISDPLRKGAVVEAGQILCQLDPGTAHQRLAEARARLPEAEARLPEARARIPEAEARVAEAEARVAEAQINLTAAQKLAEDGFAAETRVAAAQAAFESAQAGLVSARASLAAAQAGLSSAQAGVESAKAGIAAAERAIELLTIRAPFGGFLESDTAEIGSLLQPGALCATVIQLDPIKLVGFVPEIEVGRIATGSQAGARLATGEELFGTVTFLSRSADPVTRTFRVEATVPNPDARILDGQTVEMGIAADGRMAHLLPMSALTLDDEGHAGVRIVDEEHVVGFNRVTVLRDSPDGIWVSGLPETADVIVVGQEYVTEGIVVDVAYRGEGK